MNIIEIYGMRRSGNHAIISWLKHNFDKKYGKEKVIYINDIMNNHSVKNELFNQRIEQILSTDTQLLILSYEDVPCEITRLDASFKTTKFAVVRDIINLSASRFKANTGVGMRIDEKFVERWKGHATYPLIIKYEDFLLSKEARDLFCKRFEVENIDITNDLHYCSNIGSSFIGKNIDTIENYLSRYKMIELPENLKNIIDTPEVNQIREKLGYPNFCLSDQN